MYVLFSTGADALVFIGSAMGRRLTAGRAIPIALLPISIGLVQRAGQLEPESHPV